MFIGDFLLVIIERFSLDAFVLSQFTRLTDRRTDGQTESRQENRAYASQSHGKMRADLQSVSKASSVGLIYTNCRLYRGCLRA